MFESGEGGFGPVKPDFDASIRVGFGGARLTSDTGFLLLREVDERFNVLASAVSALQDHRSSSQTRHTLLEMIRQRVYQIAAGYEDCNDADYLKCDPALRLATGKKQKTGAGQSAMSRLENIILGNGIGIMALEKAIDRSADASLGKKVKPLLIIDMDSTEDPAYGTQEQVAYNGHFHKSCFHPLFAFTSGGACLAAKLRPGNVHSANGALPMLEGLTRRYRSRSKNLWFRADAAFARPELYEHCETNGVIYFIRLPANAILKEHIQVDLTRPVGRPPKNRPQVRIIDFEYIASKWTKPRRVVCKIEWHTGELFPRVGFIITNSELAPEKVVRVYNGRGDVENRIKEGKLTLRWDKTSCRRFKANEARLLMGIIAYNMLHMIRRHYMKGEIVRRSLEWMIRRLIKVAAKVSYHARRWHVQVSSNFPLAHHYRAVFSP